MVGRLGSKTEMLSLAFAGGDVALQVFLGRRFASTGCRNPELRHMFCGWIELVVANRKSNTLRDSISDTRHAIMCCHRNDKDEECAAQRLSTIEKVQIETAPRIETAPGLHKGSTMAWGLGPAQGLNTTLLGLTRLGHGLHMSVIMSSNRDGHISGPFPGPDFLTTIDASFLFPVRAAACYGAVQSAPNSADVI